MLYSQKEPLVSIIVPIYNVEPYVRKCIDSIINQTYKNLEIILVDDGSPDVCPQICDEYKEKDKRVIVIHKPNGGLSDARNAGLEATIGEYVTFIDGDDWYEPEAIECLVRKAEDTNAEIVCMGFKIAEDNIPSKKDNRHLPGRFSSEEYLLQMCGKKRSESVCDKLFKSSIIHSLRFEKSRLNEDFLFLSNILLEHYDVFCIEYWGYNYYKRQGSITNSNLNSIRDGIFNAIELRSKAISANNHLAENAFSQVALFQARAILFLVPAKEIIFSSKDYLLAMQTIKKYYSYLLISNNVIERKYRMQIIMFRLLPKVAPLLAAELLRVNKYVRVLK